MSLNDVTFIKGAGGLGRTLASEDPISGLAFYDVEFETTAQMVALGITGFTEDIRIIEFNSLRDFQDVTGITETSNAATKLYWYQVKEYFRMTVGTLYIGLFTDTSQLTVPVAINFNELYDLQIFADGKIRQAGILLQSNTLITGDVELIQGVCNTLETEHMPLSVLYGADTSATVLTALPDFSSLSTVSPQVSVVIAQDGGNVGAALATTLGVSVPAIGLTLGTVSLSRVNESIAWVEKFNIAFGGELEKPAFGDGTLVKDVATGTVSDINDKRYIFGLKHIGIDGTYFNDNHTCDKLISDYAYIAEVRTIDKAIREIRTSLLPSLNSPVKINAKTGEIASLTILYLENEANKPLSSMIINNELSDALVTIDPKQNILETSKIEVTVQLVPYGTARNIEVTIGFTVEL